MSICYATIQRKILPQLAGLMTLEKQGFRPKGNLFIELEFSRTEIQAAVIEMANQHGWGYTELTLYFTNHFGVTFIPSI